MALLTIDADPIVPLATARTMLSGLGNNDDLAVLLVNQVSAQFRSYTGRVYINRQTSDITEYQRGLGDSRLWVHATPINTSATTTVYVLSDGATSETLTGTQLTIYADQGEILREGGVWPLSDEERNIKITYRGGWVTVPGDIVASAMVQIRFAKQQFEGPVGVTSINRGTESVSYEQGQLLESVRKCWDKYRILV